MKALPYDVLSRLGINFLQHDVYENLMSADESFALAACNDTGLVGVIGVTRLPRVTMSRIGLRKSYILRRAAIAAASSPIFAIDFIGSLVMPYKVEQLQFDGIPWHEVPELFTISVADSHRSKGIGARLLTEAQNILMSEGRKHFVVKTSYPNAEKFYRSCGFRVLGSQNRIVRKFSVLICEIQ